MNRAFKYTEAARPRKVASGTCLIGFLSALLVLANCSPVPMGRGVVSRTAHLDFDTFPSTGSTKTSQSASSRSRLHETDIVPLKDGRAALRHRLEVMDGARQRLDISAFLIRQDNAGYLFADRILKAADRGVKVRLLLDDLLNRATAGRFLVLDHHPNIDIRIFNPFSRFTPLPVGFLLEYERVSRRMHSRLMVADGQVAILGGRNIGDEYFSDNGSSAFTDFELLARGSVVAQFSETFEMYWSDRWALPLSQLGTRDHPARFAKLLKEVAFRSKDARDNKYPAIMRSDPMPVDRDRPPRFVAQTEFVTDVPEKVRQDRSDGPFQVAESHFTTLKQAEREVLIVTPYFIPEEHVSQVLQSLVARGVHVTVVTNSLASTNHPAVHGGYSSYRDRLIRAGVIFHELKPSNGAAGDATGIQNTLHAKFTVVDGFKTIVTTMNFDPVSIKGNLETSLIVRSRAFADWMLKRVNPIAFSQTYRLKQEASGSLAWLAESGAGSPQKIREPGANLARRLISGFSQLLVSESML